MTIALRRLLNQIEKEQKQKLYTEQEVRDIIGNFAHESDGWDFFFLLEDDCCPGDDYASICNFIKVLQLKKAGLKIDKKDFEKQTGSYLKYTLAYIKKYLKKIKSS